HPTRGGGRSLGGPARRFVGGEGTRHAGAARGHGGAPPHEEEPHGGARPDAAGGRTRGGGGAARRPARAPPDHRRQRPCAGEAVRGLGWRHRRGGEQAGGLGGGRCRPRDLPRAQAAGPLCRCRRGVGRPGSLRPRGLREGVARRMKKWMGRAFELAERGRYSVSPNPMVGAVLVKNGRMIGEGGHRRAGGPHAEIEALRRAGRAARGADLYVPLEPCAHHGRPPPCTDALVAAGVRRVFFAVPDPNPRVAGRGARILRNAGIRVSSGSASDRLRAERQNEKFFVSMRRRRPFVLAKWASTLDGRIADAAGESRWISGPEARRRARLWREGGGGVRVGGAALVPRRLGVNRSTPHTRIVLDGSLRVPERARILRRPEGLILATAEPVTHPKARRLARRGVTVWSLPGRRRGGVDLRRLL